jgi:hypothetical protein
MFVWPELKSSQMDSVPVGSIQLDGAKIFSIQGPKKGHQFCLGLYARTRYARHRDKSPVSTLTPHSHMA